MRSLLVSCMARILFLSERFPPDIGGLAASTARISKCLAGSGHDVDVLAWSRHLQAAQLEDCSNSAEGEETGLTVYKQGLYRNWDLTMAAAINVIDWLHEKHPYDLIWGHYLSKAGFLAVWVGENKNIPSIVSARGNDIDTEVFPPGDFARLQWTLQRASAVSAVSRDLASKIRVIAQRDDVRVIHNSVDAEQFRPDFGDASLRQNLGIAADEVILGFAGELREKKGMQFLLEAFKQVKEAMNAVLLIIGEVRQQQKVNLQLFAAENPDAASRVIITGHLQEARVISEHLNLCDLFLLPSIMEGFPNSLLEAMSCERLCLASDAGGIPELLEHEKNGFIIKKTHLNHLSTAIRESLQLPDVEKRRLVSAARDTVLNRFNLEIERAQLTELVDALLSKKR